MTAGTTKAEPVTVTRAETPTAPQNAPQGGATEAEAKAFIYFKESSNQTDRVNSIGCIGLGQDCNGALAAECPSWQTDRACQDVFWEKYMSRRYGSWNKAKAHWLARVPINGKDVGNWW